MGEEYRSCYMRHDEFDGKQDEDSSDDEREEPAAGQQDHDGKTATMLPHPRELELAARRFAHQYITNSTANLRPN